MGELTALSQNPMAVAVFKGHTSKGRREAREEGREGRGRVK